MIFKLSNDKNYRLKSEVTLLGPKGKVLAQNSNGYIELPGGGVNDGESPVVAAARELLEETGLKAKKLVLAGSSKFKYPKSWEKNLKRDGMFGKHLGMEVNHYVGELSEISKPTSKEGDAWSDMLFWDVDKIKKEMEKETPPELDQYRKVQVGILEDVKKNISLEKAARAPTHSLAHRESRRNRQGYYIGRQPTKAMHHADRLRGNNISLGKGETRAGTGSPLGTTVGGAGGKDAYVNFYANGGVLGTK